MSRQVVARVGEIAPGDCKIVSVRGREVGLFNMGGEYFALSNRCPHKGAELCRGMIVGLPQSSTPGEYRLSRSGEFIRCPWHGWFCKLEGTRLLRSSAPLPARDGSPARGCERSRANAPAHERHEGLYVIDAANDDPSNRTGKLTLANR